MTIAQQLEKATADLAAANLQIAAFDNEKSGAVNEAMKPVHAERDTATAALTTEQVAHTATKGLLAAATGEVTKLKGEAQTAEQRAAQIAAGQQVPPVPPEENKGQGNSAEELRTQFAAMKSGKDRSAFYQKHKQHLR